MIYITMNKAIPIDMDYRGVSITGTLNFYQQEDNIYGFELSGVSAKEFNVSQSIV